MELRESPLAQTELYQERLENFNPVAQFLEEFESEQGRSKLVLVHKNLEELKTEVWSQYKIKIAAGGIVSNPNQEILMIKRFGKWEFPKGHQEKGERIEETALREVMEETGIRGLSLSDHLHTSFHTYKLKGRLALKETYWYKMTVKSLNDLSPQREEGIEAVEWVGEDWLERTQNSYENVKQLLAKVKNLPSREPMNG